MRFLNWLSSLWPFVTKRFHAQEVARLKLEYARDIHYLHEYYAGRAMIAAWRGMLCTNLDDRIPKEGTYIVDQLIPEVIEE